MARQCSLLKPDGTKCALKAVYGPTHANPVLCLGHASEYIPGTRETMASSLGFKPCKKLCSYPECTVSGTYFNPAATGARVFRCTIHKVQGMISNGQWRRRTRSDPGSRRRIPHTTMGDALQQRHRRAATTLATMSDRSSRRLEDIAAQALLGLSQRT